MHIHISPGSQPAVSLALFGLAIITSILTFNWTLARSPHSGMLAPISLQQPSAPIKPTPLAKKVSAALAKEAKLKKEKIQVDTAPDGKVRLSGTLSNHPQRLLALRVAEKTVGKGKIANEFSIQCSSSSCGPTQCCICTDDPKVCSCEAMVAGNCPGKPKPKKAK